MPKKIKRRSVALKIADYWFGRQQHNFIGMSDRRIDAAMKRAGVKFEWWQKKRKLT